MLTNRLLANPLASRLRSRGLSFPRTGAPPAGMKRKKWREEEEESLIAAYSAFLSSSSPLSKLRTTRQKKFQPIADRVNAAHHLRDPSSFPFLWSWRDVSIKIHNMRHQFLNVKQKLLLSSLDPSHALHLWPNFLRYKAVFGDLDLDLDLDSPSKSSDDIDAADDDDDSEADKDTTDQPPPPPQQQSRNWCSKRSKKRRWRRREERREIAEMEWMERVVAMQMDHEKRALQMHADACQAQLHMIGILVRVVCQFLGPAPGPTGGGDGGIPNLGVENLNLNLQQRQRTEEEETATESLVGDDGNRKNDGHSGAAGYL